MESAEARDLVASDENLLRVQKRMRRIFVSALVLSGAVAGVYVFTHASAFRANPVDSALGAILFWSLVVTAYAFNSMRVFTDELAVQLAQNQFLDPLTNAFNFRYVRHRMREEETRIRRYGGGAAVLYIDLDKFKPVNDTYGHHVGNVVLQEVVDMLRGSIRQCDILGRVGGDEFVVLLPMTGLPDAMILARRLCETVREHPVLVEGIGTIDWMRVSIGVGAYPDTGNSLDSVVASADKAVYIVKEQGGDGVGEAKPYAPTPSPE